MSALHKITKVLIANRSEVVSRINFSCQKMGIKTVSIYSPEDQLLPYVFQTNQNHALTKNGPAAYLNQDEIINIALKTKCDAIHPGYGFLSENSQFAQKVIDSGLVWIGPTPETIKLMGDKTCAREMMQKVGVPVIPGFHFLESEKDIAQKFAAKIGYPVLLKDPLGGGGKAIQKIENAQEFEIYFSTIFAEAKKMTGSDKIILEKYIQNGRHIEIQIAGDGSNGGDNENKVVHFYERECSIQRRHQKIIEEAPCNFLDKKTLNKMYQAAIKAAKSVNYQNIGTVEFIVTTSRDLASRNLANNDLASHDFYFLEMNTRLQVEHSVTELTTGIDLVALQLEIAQTKKLNICQKDISQKNHAIECRIYSEDTKNNFLPASGTITYLNTPSGAFIRNDNNLEIGQEITPFFDPMISKLTCWGRNRKDSINNMVLTLSKFKINGIKNNINFLKAIFKTDEFVEGNIHTQLLNNKKYFEKLITQKTINNDNQISENEIASIAAYLFSQLNTKTKKRSANKTTSIWRNQKWQ